MQTYSLWKWDGICRYLVWRPCSRLVLVVSKDEERQRAELRVLKGRVELVTRCLQVLIWRGTVQHKHDALWPLVVTAPVFFDVVSTYRQNVKLLNGKLWESLTLYHTRTISPSELRRTWTFPTWRGQSRLCVCVCLIKRKNIRWFARH